MFCFRIGLSALQVSMGFVLPAAMTQPTILVAIHTVISVAGFNVVDTIFDLMEAEEHDCDLEENKKLQPRPWTQLHLTKNSSFNSALTSFRRRLSTSLSSSVVRTPPSPSSSSRSPPLNLSAAMSGTASKQSPSKYSVKVITSSDYLHEAPTFEGRSLGSFLLLQQSQRGPGGSGGDHGDGGSLAPGEACQKVFDRSSVEKDRDSVVVIDEEKNSTWDGRLPHLAPCGQPHTSGIDKSWFQDRSSLSSSSSVQLYRDNGNADKISIVPPRYGYLSGALSTVEGISMGSSRVHVIDADE